MLEEAPEYMLNGEFDKYWDMEKGEWKPGTPEELIKKHKEFLSKQELTRKKGLIDKDDNS